MFKRNISVYYQGNQEQKIKSGKNSSTFMKTTDHKRDLRKRGVYKNMFLQLIQPEILMLKKKIKHY